MTTRGQWAHLFLGRLQYPTTDENVLGVLTWIRSEFGTQVPIPARNNPLATTMKHQGSTKFNEAGVQHFKSVADGVEANAEVVLQHHQGYDAIRSLLTNGHAADELVVAIHDSAWGSKPTVDLLANVRRDFQRDALLLVSEDDVAGGPTPSVGVPAWPGTLLADFTEGHGAGTWQARMASRGWRIVVDDKYGPHSAATCEAFQAEKGLQVDGIVGPITWEATWVAPIT